MQGYSAAVLGVSM